MALSKSLSRRPATSEILLLGLRGVFVGCVAALAIGSLLPANSLPGSSFQDKLVHLGGYAFVSCLALLAVRQRHHQLATLVLLTLLGAALEFGQMLVPGRSFEFADMAANGTGVWGVFLLHRFLV